MNTEESFPRGNIEKTKQKSFADENSLVFQGRKRKRPYSESNVASTKKSCVTDMSYSEIREDMLVLACVRSISTMALEVELPGRMCGKIKITSVSDPLTKLLEEKTNNDDINKETPPLVKLFHVGQFIPTRVLQKTLSKTGTQLFLSANPKDIHRGWSYANFVKGSFIWAAVELELEHGYQLNVGVNACRLFLPFKKIENNTKYVIGQTLYAVITKCAVDSEVSTVVVSTLEKDVGKLISKDNMDLFHITPGSCINFTVTDVLSNGLQGTFSKQTGFIPEAYLDISYEDISILKYNSGDNFKAFLLYVQPDTNCAYFSLRGISSSSQADFTNGTRLNAEVFKSRVDGVYLKLTNYQIGFVSHKRISKNFKVKDYPVGSQQSVQILDYRRFEQLYICTFAQNNERVNITKDVKQTLEIGELVTGTIVKVLKEGILIGWGKSKGFVQNIHLDKDLNVEVGSMVQAKVWNLNDNKVYLTTKKLLLDSDVCLKTKADAVVGKQYPGVVVKKGLQWILVTFYGDIRGILSKKHLMRVFGKNAYDVFEEGEVILPTILKAEDILTLGLKVPNKPKFKHFNSIKVGDYVTGTVKQVTPNGLVVKAGSKNGYCFILTPHLSSSLPLTSLLINTYKAGDVIDDLLCISKTNLPLLSIREAKAYRKSNLRILTMSEISVGSIIRCSFINSFETRIRVIAPFVPDSKFLHLYENDLDKGAIKSYKLHQAVVSKVTRFNSETKTVKITARSEELCKWSYDDALNYLEQYLEDVQRIQTCLSDKFRLSRLRLGQKVKCVVKSSTNNKFSVLLEDNIDGIVDRVQADKNVKVGDSTEGVVLWKDVTENCVILSLKQDVIDCIGEDQEADVQLEDTISASVLVIKPEFIVTATKEKQILFVPVLKSNYNLRLPKYKLFQEIKVIVKKKAYGVLVGVDNRILKILDMAKKAFDNKTSPSKNSVEPVQKLKEMEVDDDENLEQDNEENVTAYNISLSINEVLQNHTKSVVTLPGVNGFFTQEKSVKSESSSDEDVEEIVAPKKKKKMTAAERAEVARHAEERIRDKEIELADGTAEPQSEEQFERLVTGKPNSSELWAKYIAYCVSNAEIHKARNIAQAALKRIDLNQTAERYNIWITLLNLENSYGDKHSFDTVFQEAVRCNDDLQIYLDVINLLASSEKYTEMNEKIKKVKSKHKQNPKMWTSLALVYYKCGQLKDARNIQSSALKTVEKKSNHIDLIVQFAIMEFNHGEKHHAEALFETILQSNPKRVDVWSTYIDQMIKKENVEGARRVLERAVSQQIPAKKMKTLFKKYKDLELKYGDEDSVAHVIDLAQQYLGEK